MPGLAGVGGAMSLGGQRGHQPPSRARGRVPGIPEAVHAGAPLPPRCPHIFRRL